MESTNNYLEILCVVLSALLAYGFGRYQHRIEYKDDLKNNIFGLLLTIDLPKAYMELMNNYDDSEKYNIFSEKLVELVNKICILQISNKRKYNNIRKIVIEINELACFNSNHLLNGVEVPVKITEIKCINERKKEIDSKIKKLYRIIGVNDYKNVLYAGNIKILMSYVHDKLFNNYKD